MDVTNLEFGSTKREIGKSITLFRKEMEKEIKEGMMCLITKEFYLSYLYEDVKLLREILVLGQEGIKLVNEMLTDAYFAYDELYYKSRYAEVSAGLRLRIENIGRILHQNILDGKKITKKQMELMKITTPMLYKFITEEY